MPCPVITTSNDHPFKITAKEWTYININIVTQKGQLVLLICSVIQNI